jgi:hypothetical protein
MADLEREAGLAIADQNQDRGGRMVRGPVMERAREAADAAIGVVVTVILHAIEAVLTCVLVGIEGLLCRASAILGLLARVHPFLRWILLLLVIIVGLYGTICRFLSIKAILENLDKVENAVNATVH